MLLVKAYFVKEIKLQNLSKHLFWDYNFDVPDKEKNKKLIVKRVMDYGLLSDWKILYECYGLDEIVRIAVDIKDLEKKSAAFLSVLSQTPLKKFACYTTKQLTQKHWTF